MLKARVNQISELEIEVDLKAGGFKIDARDIAVEIFKSHKHILQVIKGTTTYDVLILKFNPKEKTALIKVNGNKYEVQLRDKYDELLSKLGMDLSSAKKVNNIKAPMPGLVLNVLVAEGGEVKKGDALIVLEAMKMENILKSPADGLIKKISVKKGVAVEKNQVLIEF